MSTKTIPMNQRTRSTPTSATTAESIPSTSLILHSTATHSSALPRKNNVGSGGSTSSSRRKKYSKSSQSSLSSSSSSSSRSATESKSKSKSKKNKKESRRRSSRNSQDGSGDIRKRPQQPPPPPPLPFTTSRTSETATAASFNPSKVSLHRTRSSLGSQHQTTSIDKHYMLNNQIYDAFMFHWDTLNNSNKNTSNSSSSTSSSSLVSGAFYLGIQFVETALLEIPKHGYFYSNENRKHVKLRSKSSESTLDVIVLLQRIIDMQQKQQQKDGSSMTNDGDERSRKISTRDDDDGIMKNKNKKLTLEECSADCVLEHSDEWKTKLSTLKELAIEQRDHLDTYESKRTKVEKEWYENDNSSNSTTGLHRGTNRRNEKDGLLKTSSTAKSNSATSGGKVLSTSPSSADCNKAMGATLLSCSNFFCPTVLSSSSRDLMLSSSDPLPSTSPPSTPYNGNVKNNDSSSNGNNSGSQQYYNHHRGNSISMRRSSTYHYHPPILSSSSSRILHGTPTRSSLIDDDDESDVEDNIVMIKNTGSGSSRSSKKKKNGSSSKKEKRKKPPLVPTSTGTSSSWNHATIKKATSSSSSGSSGRSKPSTTPSESKTSAWDHTTIKRETSGRSSDLKGRGSSDDPIIIAPTPATTCPVPKPTSTSRKGGTPPNTSTSTRKNGSTPLDPPQMISDKNKKTTSDPPTIDAKKVTTTAVKQKAKKEVANDTKSTASSSKSSSAVRTKSKSPTRTTAATTTTLSPNRNLGGIGTKKKRTHGGGSSSVGSKGIMNKLKATKKNIKGAVGKAITGGGGGADTNKNSSNGIIQVNQADTDLEQALYLSELEAAKAASIASEDEYWSGDSGDESCSYIGGVGVNKTNNNNGNNFHDSGRSLSTTGSTSAAVAADYDLQRALYLSGLEVKTQNGMLTWEQEQQLQYDKYAAAAAAAESRQQQPTWQHEQQVQYDKYAAANMRRQQVQQQQQQQTQPPDLISGPSPPPQTYAHMMQQQQQARSPPDLINRVYDQEENRDDDVDHYQHRRHRRLSPPDLISGDNSPPLAPTTTDFASTPPPPLSSNDTTTMAESPSLLAAKKKRRSTSSMIVSFDTLKFFYHEDFDTLLDSGRVKITTVPTYQGRIPDSTNGCTVIAPLICIHHFNCNSGSNKKNSKDKNANDKDNTPIAPIDLIDVDSTTAAKMDIDGSGATSTATAVAPTAKSAGGGGNYHDDALPIGTITKVIDEICPRILPQIRKNLGLTKNAFLIPHDAHEALSEDPYNMMSGEQFLTVCGGNILEEKHLGVLIEELSTIRSKKLGATFFFHQHVIAILQIRRPSKTKIGETVLWYDIIDSLPQHRFLERIRNTGTANDNNDGVGQQQQPHQKDLLGNATEWIHNQWDDLMDETRALRDAFVVSPNDATTAKSGSNRSDSDKSNNSNITFSSGADQELLDQPDAVRIRCYDTVSLKVALQWYACSVFTNENADYIDTYQWDEKLTDFDPRVFQAFLWTEA